MEHRLPMGPALELMWMMLLLRLGWPVGQLEAANSTQPQMPWRSSFPRSSAVRCQMMEHRLPMGPPLELMWVLLLLRLGWPVGQLEAARPSHFPW